MTWSNRVQTGQLQLQPGSDVLSEAHSIASQANSIAAPVDVTAGNAFLGLSSSRMMMMMMIVILGKHGGGYFQLKLPCNPVTLAGYSFCLHNGAELCSELTPPIGGDACRQGSEQR